MFATKKKTTKKTERVYDIVCTEFRAIILKTRLYIYIINYSINTMDEFSTALGGAYGSTGYFYCSYFAIGMAANDNVPYIVVHASQFQGGRFTRGVFVEKVLRMRYQVTGVSN